MNPKLNISRSSVWTLPSSVYFGYEYVSVKILYFGFCHELYIIYQLFMNDLFTHWRFFIQFLSYNYIS